MKLILKLLNGIIKIKFSHKILVIGFAAWTALALALALIRNFKHKKA